MFVIIYFLYIRTRDLLISSYELFSKRRILLVYYGMQMILTRSFICIVTMSEDSLIFPLAKTNQLIPPTTLTMCICRFNLIRDIKSFFSSDISVACVLAPCY